MWLIQTRKQTNARSDYREAEGVVRELVLKVCGAAVEHPDCPPGLVNAIISIQLYGHYFIDTWEREALKGIIQRFKDVRAWPLPNALQSFR